MSVPKPDPAGPGSTAAQSHERATQARRIVFKNTLFLTFAQVVCVPLSVLHNALMGRFLGAKALGYIYVGNSFTAFGFLAVDWGASGALPALVAKDRARAGRLLGTTLVWRALMSVLVAGVLTLACRLMGKSTEVQIVVAMLSGCAAITSISNACQAAIIGLERADISAYRQIVEHVSVLVIVFPILWFTRNVYAALAGIAGALTIVTVLVWRSLRRVGIDRLGFDRETLRDLLRTGTPFVFVGLAMVLQPTVDALWLSELAPDEVVGWHGAARRLVGFLVFPASAITGALYPTLSRLFVTDLEAFRRTASAALRATTLVIVPIALGCALFAELGIAIYGRSLGPGSANLRVLSLFVFLLCLSMPLGIAILASGRQRVWSMVQFICVLVSAVGDPLLIRWFQQRTGNGGLGVCTAAVASEVIVVIFGVVLSPSGVLDRAYWRALSRALLAGAAMAAVAVLLRSVNAFVVAPLSVLAYAGVLWLVGGVDKTLIASLRDAVRRRLSARR